MGVRPVRRRRPDPDGAAAPGRQPGVVPGGGEERVRLRRGAAGPPAVPRDGHRHVRRLP
ncbi:hypothetical protein V2I01_37815 [Micromonospora sp. BRA006-A]|nr:hypothetical protein [Micromonospora sp. BRA006-A]